VGETTADINKLLFKSDDGALLQIEWEANKDVGSKSKRLSIEDRLKISAASSAFSIPISSCNKAGICMK
jgi:hypothetical protein